MSRTYGRSTRSRRRRRNALIITVTCALIVVCSLGGLYLHLDGNIRSLALFGGVSGNAGVERVDAFGRSPINLLLIGSDGRNNPIDCHLGGDCGPGANADVEMVVHISADRSNATVMSVPRDTVTDLPACRDAATGASTAGGVGQINATLSYGPGCTVAAVHQLTGVPIDHFVMVDFAGVVTMSDTVGGVSVCVSDNVFDPYSHLLLSKGSHTLKGLGALEFVRSRHAFGDGSDLGRTYAQHLFLTAVIRNMKSARTLTDPATLYSLADSATKALTVDTGLGSIPSLIGLAADLDKVSSDRITFTTMQTIPDPADPARVVVAPSAQQLFSSIVNDQSLTNAAGTKAPSGGATATPVVRSRISVRVLNGSGTAHRAATIAAALASQGFGPATGIATAPAIATATTLQYGTGRRADAAAVAAALRLPAAALRAGTGTGLVLTIGTDWPGGSTFGRPSASLSADQQRAAVAQAHARTAATPAGCAPVSTQNTVVYNGVAMTPSRAYTLARRDGVPLSAA